MRHERRRFGGWALWVDGSAWRDEWWAVIDRRLDAPEGAVRTSRHARTTRLSLPAPEGERSAYLKVYRAAGGTGWLKDLVRRGKARRALAASAALAAEGFAVPPVLAAGELRRLQRLWGAFLLTSAVAWPALAHLAAELSARPAGERRSGKWAMLAALGGEVGRLHENGWVHGDLVVTNVLAAERPPRFCFLDHDRTRRPPLGRRRQQRRNLIQLNRIALPGVTHADRLRAFVAYARARGWSAATRRREARRLAEATRRRRLEIDRLAARRTARAPAS